MGRESVEKGGMEERVEKRKEQRRGNKERVEGREAS